MVASLLQLEDLGDGQIRVAFERGPVSRSYQTPLPFADPLTDEDRADLRWYLEDFLSFPYGAEPDKAARIEGRMEEWGTALFRAAFPRLDASPDPRALYEEAISQGIEQCELAIVSEDPAFLNIPWELLYDPTPGRQYLAPLLGGLFRQRRGHALTAPPTIDPNQPFRILLVVSRPYGARDVPLGTVARPMLEALRDRWPQIEVELLRPPTFDALQRRLNERPGHYSLVHFDGHGVFAEDHTANQTGTITRFGARAGAGRLVFEIRDGQPHPVPSADLGQALATCKVPLFVLNACQSAEEGRDDPFASVAAQLVAIGATGVVAMSYSVYASAAGMFVGRLYERLVEGSILAGAVAEGRRALFADSHRESLIGPLPLRDWLVPTVYQQATSFQPVAATSTASPVQVPEQAIALRRHVQEVTRPPGRFGFIGRDYDLLRIERALSDSQRPSALLSGVGGTGKTALAYGFARWYYETGGCPGGIFVTSFKSAASFAQVVGSIDGYGTDLSRFPPEEQRRILSDHLRQTPCLLIWDNVEGVAGYPEGTTPLATDAERAELATFLQDLRGGKTRVIVTTRKQDELWIGVDYSLIETAGLTDRDRAQLAESILRTVDKRPSDFRNDPQYADLLKLLRGHPRSMEIVLPLLRRQSPGQILDALQHQTATDDATLLDASHAYVFDNLSERARRHLPIVGFFTGVVRSETVVFFVASGDEQQQAYEEVVGDALDAAGWQAILAEAARTGLLRERIEGVYELHPTLPPFLRGRLLALVGEAGVQRLDAEFVRCCATIGRQLLDGAWNADRQALSLLTAEEPNLLRALWAAQRAEVWPHVQDIVQTIATQYQAQGRLTEWRRLRDGLLSQIRVDFTTRLPVDAAAELWMFLLGEHASESLLSGHFDRADTTYRTILACLQALDDPTVEPKTAVVYHQLGIAAEGQGHLDEAEALYQQALAIRARLSLEREAAGTMHQLGIIAQRRGRLDDAEIWYQRALTIFERLGREREAAGTMHQLGSVAQERGRLDEADSWYGPAFEIYERLGLEQDAADTMHNLGVVAQDRGRLDEADAWYRPALEIYGRIGLERQAAGTMHQLGIIAQRRGRLDEAKDWYQHALIIRRRLGMKRDAADTIHQLGNVAHREGRLDDAEALYQRALALFERLAPPLRRVNTLAQIGVLYRTRADFPEAVRWLGRAYQIAVEYQVPVLSRIIGVLAHLYTGLGEEQFRAAWQSEFPGHEPPLEAIRQAQAQQASQEPPAPPS